MPKADLKQKAKKLAGSFFIKLLEKKEEEEEETPPKPPPKPYTSSEFALGTQDAAFGLIQPFNSLSVNTPPGGEFVGGFRPGYSVPGRSDVPSLQHASSAPPPTMPSPLFPSSSPPAKQSLTMQMALQQPAPASNRPSRPTSASSVPFTQSQILEIRPVFTASKPKPSSVKTQRPATPGSDNSYTPSDEAVPKPASNLTKRKPFAPSGDSTKVKASASSDSGQVTPSKTPKRTKVFEPIAPSNGSASPPPSTPNGKGLKEGQVQCSGTTKAGKRCTRMVKAAPALSQVIDDDDDSDDSEPSQLERFCFQHTKELLTSSGCYARKNGEWVEFSAWIPSYLQYDTQVLLRIEMEKARSMSDQDGYIYTFEIREDDSDEVKLKVGRAVNIAKRIDEWSKQCGSKQQVLRGFYPNPEDDDDAPATLMKGRVKAGQKSACCHRLERLIHLELADLAATEIYLDPAWPNLELDDSRATTATKTSPEKRSPCPDCGSRHKEIFEFRRWTKGKNRNKEYEKIVKPVIERWGKFIELYL